MEKSIFRICAAIVVSCAWACIATEESREGTCGGRVVDEQNVGIGGLNVEVSWEDSPGHMTSRKCLTDAGGHWQIALPVEVREVDIRLEHRDYINDESSRTGKPSMPHLRDGTSIMVMKKGLKVRAVVRSVDGTPIANALILPHGRYATTAGGAALEDTTTARTAPDGSFVLSGLAAGPRELTVTANGFGPESVPVDVEESTAPLEIVMRAGGVFQGRVMDEDGKPVEGAGIYSRSWELRRRHIVSLTARTDAEGRFTLRDVPREGSLQFYFSKKELLLREDTIYLPQGAPYEITLYRPPIISGTVVDGETGSPIADFQVSDGIMWSRDDQPYWRDPQPTHSDEGAFRREVSAFIMRQSLPACVIRIAAAGYVPETTPTVTVGEKPGSFVVRLQKGRPWTGVVRNPAGAPVPRANIAWIGPGRRAFIKNGSVQLRVGPSPDWVVQTDSEGRFELPPSKTDGVILALHDTGYGWWHTSGFARGSAVSLTPWARIAGTVRIADSNNHSIGITMRPVDKEEQTAPVPIRWVFDETSHVDGRFVFDRVPSIPLAIGHVFDDKFFLARHLTPPAGQESRVDIAAQRPEPPPVRPLTGTVLPDMKDLGITLDTSQAKNKRLLVCFFDMAQRPSRHCLLQLAEQAESLGEKGVQIIAVQASAVDRNTLDTWLAAHKLGFPVGRIDKNIERVASSWGVRSLPWLILTDRNHVVIREGLALEELDKAIGR